MYIEPIETLRPLPFVFDIVLDGEAGFGADVSNGEVCLGVGTTEVRGATVEFAVCTVAVVVVRDGTVVYLCEGVRRILHFFIREQILGKRTCFE